MGQNLFKGSRSRTRMFSKVFMRSYLNSHAPGSYNWVYHVSSSGYCTCYSNSTLIVCFRQNTSVVFLKIGSTYSKRPWTGQLQLSKCLFETFYSTYGTYWYNSTISELTSLILSLEREREYSNNLFCWRRMVQYSLSLEASFLGKAPAHSGFDVVFNSGVSSIN